MLLQINPLVIYSGIRVVARAEVDILCTVHTVLVLIYKTGGYFGVTLSICPVYHFEYL